MGRGYEARIFELTHPFFGRSFWVRIQARLPRSKPLEIHAYMQRLPPLRILVHCPSRPPTQPSHLTKPQQKNSLGKHIPSPLLSHIYPLPLPSPQTNPISKHLTSIQSIAHTHSAQQHPPHTTAKSVLLFEKGRSSNIISIIRSQKRLAQ